MKLTESDLLEIKQAKFREIIDKLIREELEPLMIGDCAYTYVIHQGKTELLAEKIRKALVEQLVQATTEVTKTL